MQSVCARVDSLSRAYAFCIIISYMRCLHPVMMYKRGYHPSGKPRYSRFPSDADIHQLAIPVPCGKCIACLFNRRRQWRDRLLSESWLHDYSSFVTLTYNDDHLPIGIPCKHDVQTFLKRFRQIPRNCSVVFDSFKYFIALELGDLHSRPHYHGVFFGVNLLDDVFEPDIVGIKDGHAIYTSRLLERTWSNGFVTVDNTNAAVVNYVTKYVLKQSDNKDLWFIYSRSLGLRNFLYNGQLTDFGRQAVDNGYYQVGDWFRSSKTSLPRALVRRLESIDPCSFSFLKARNKRFAQLGKTDARSAAELASVLNWRHHKENNKRILDNAT